MVTLSAEHSGEATKQTRLLLGITPERIATVTNLNPADILALEERDDPLFTLRVLYATGFIQLYVQSLKKAAKTGTPPQELEKFLAPVIAPLQADPRIAETLKHAIPAPGEEAKNPLLTEPLPLIGSKPTDSPSSVNWKKASTKVKEIDPQTNYPDSAPQQVRREFQRAHESLSATTDRLGRKYGQDQLLAAVISGYEKARGVTPLPLAKDAAKFISVSQAAEQFGIPASALSRGITEGVLQNVGRFQHPAQPEIGVIFVDQNEVQRVKEKLGVGEEIAQPKLLTLKQAAETHGIAYGTLYSWLRSGDLPEKGREIFHTDSGGKTRILVDDADVRRVKNHPPARGRRSTND